MVGVTDVLTLTFAAGHITADLFDDSTAYSIRLAGSTTVTHLLMQLLHAFVTSADVFTAGTCVCASNTYLACLHPVWQLYRRCPKARAVDCQGLI